MSEFSNILARLSRGETLTAHEAEDTFTSIMSGDVSPIAIASFLTALSVRGETVEEIIGGARVMRAHADKINASANIVDTCGTGGTGIDSYNISTASAFICAAAGVPVAKHGNRAASSRSGSADVLEALGGSLDLGFRDVERALTETGFTFMFARAHHSAMRHVAPVRGELKFKTIFNLLGPLSSPALAKRQVLGVFDKKWLMPLAEVLKELGSEHVWLVHGRDGLDEVTTTSETDVVELKNGVIRELVVSPEDVGIQRATLSDIQGGDPEYNAKAIRSVFEGEQCPFRDITLMNTAAALLVAGKIETLNKGIELASRLIDSGAAMQSLQSWVDFTQKAAKT